MTLEIFKQAAATLLNPEVKEWKKQDGKVLGYFYSHVPEEIITAAGMLPFRIRGTGSNGTEFSDSHFTQINCGFVRHTFDMILQGKLGFLDGVVSFNYCDHLRRLQDNWMAKENNRWFHFINFPKKNGEQQIELYRQELVKFKECLETQFGVIITDEKLNAAIKLHNETRRLQRQIYELRKKKNPPLTGAQTLAAMVAGTAMPKERYNQLLKKLISELGEGQNVPAVRLMLVGGEIDDPALVELLESQGGMIVTDSLAYGVRSILGDVAENSDPLSALAVYYLKDKEPCPRIFGTGSQRFDFVKKTAAEYEVDGVISTCLLLCDIWGFEQDELSRFLKKEQLPHLRLDVDYILGSVGQLKTRVQAFIETVKDNAPK